MPVFEDSESEADTEDRIENFLDDMGIEMIIPSEVGTLRINLNKNNSYTPTLKLGSSLLLSSRKKNYLKSSASFSDFM